MAILPVDCIVRLPCYYARRSNDVAEMTSGARTRRNLPPLFSSRGSGSVCQRIRVEEKFVLSQRFDSWNDRAGLRLEQISAGAGLLRLLDHSVDRVLAKDEYFSVGHRSLDLRRGA